MNFLSGNALSIVQLVISILLIVVILMQGRGSGLGSAFGGAGVTYQTKRGFEKWLYYATIVLVIIFIGTAIANLLI